jgi:two-component system, chemotaxis family, sensor kinase Cph1
LLEQRVSERTEELRLRNEELDRTNRDLDDFAYIASHDLKEPLRGIHNYASFLLEDYEDKLGEEGKDQLETLVRLSKMMERIIDSLLEYSRVGRSELLATAVDLNQVVKEVLESLAILLSESRVEVRLAGKLSVINCDRVRVAEVFRNLISNSVKYNDKTEKWVEIGEIPDPKGPVFFVRDNGIGIPEKHREAVFQIFKRLHARDKYGGGTGAGLTIVKKIVERHNGAIWLESVIGQGTTFYFTLPGEG